MFDELRVLRDAVMEFVRSESERGTDVLKIWQKGLDLGYFNLSSLSLLEASVIFSAIHELKPELGYQLLYLSISNHVFGDKAPLAIQVDDQLVTDWIQEEYVLVSDDVKLIKASPEFLTTETFKLRGVEVLEEKKVNIKPLINILLASRCVGTALHAYNLVLTYLKEVKLSENYYHCFEKLGEIAVEVKASELLVRVAALAEPNEVEELSKMAFWKAAVTAIMAVDEVVIVQEGAYKYKEDFKVEIFRDFARIKHRNPKVASIYNLKVSEIYYPKALDFSPRIVKDRTSFTHTHGERLTLRLA